MQLHIQPSRRESLNLDPTGPHSSNYKRIPIISYEDRDKIPVRFVAPFLIVAGIIVGAMLYAGAVCNLHGILH